MKSLFCQCPSIFLSASRRLGSVFRQTGIWRPCSICVAGQVAPLRSASEAEIVANCPRSVTRGTVWFIWPFFLMCSGNAYCLLLARLSKSARENVRDIRDIRPSFLSPCLFLFSFPFRGLIEGAEQQGHRGGEPRSRRGSSQGRWRDKSPAPDVLKAV